MTPVNGAAAARTMLGFKTWHRGRCLQAVWTAYSRNGAQDLTGEREPTAYDAWAHTDLKDRRTGTPYDLIPRGVPVYFGKKASSAAGDIVISDGDGWCIATDIPGHPGVIGRIRLADRQRQIQRPYLGWSTTILDYPIAYGPALAGEGGADMPLDDKDKKWLNGMGSSIVAQVLAELANVPAEVWEHGVRMQDENGHYVKDTNGQPVIYPARGYLGSIAGRLNARIVDVDEKTLAAELAPLLTASIGTLSDADVARIAKAAADEADRRDLKRLAG